MVSITGSPRDIFNASSGSSARARWWRVAGVRQRLLTDDLAAGDQLHQQVAVIGVPARRRLDPDQLGLGHAVGRSAPGRVLPAADRGLLGALLGHADQRSRRVVGGGAGHELVDEPAGRVAAAGDQGGADAVGIHRSRRQGRDRVLVQVAGHDDLGPSGRRGSPAAGAPGRPARPGLRSPAGPRPAGPRSARRRSGSPRPRRRCRPARSCSRPARRSGRRTPRAPEPCSRVNACADVPRVGTP